MAQASAIDDPQIIIRGTGSGNTIFLTGGTTSITFGPGQVFNGPGGCFSFTPASQSSDGYDHLVCGVVNQTGSTLGGITFAISPAFQLPLTLVCSFCTSVTATPDGAYITFLFPSGFFQPNDDFQIEFVGFSQGTGIGITPVPEPATLALLATGLGALGLRRRRPLTS
jgi:hypothetical protein